jgi:hypothetical protein
VTVSCRAFLQVAVDDFNTCVRKKIKMKSTWQTKLHFIAFELLLGYVSHGSLKIANISSLAFFDEFK